MHSFVKGTIREWIDFNIKYQPAIGTILGLTVLADNIIEHDAFSTAFSKFKIMTADSPAYLLTLPRYKAPARHR